MSDFSSRTIDAVSILCSGSPVAASWLPIGAPLIALFGVLLTIIGKWYFDRQAEKREALSLLRAAFSELGAQVAEVERVGLVAALKTYQQGISSGKIFPLIVDLPNDHLHVTKLAIEKCGHLGMDVASVLAELHHGAQAIYTTMRTIQKIVSVEAHMLGDFKRVDLLLSLYQVLEVQVVMGVDRFKFARQKFAGLL